MSAVQDFAKFLAGLDEEGRKRAFAQANLLSAKEAPPEAFEPDVTLLRDYLARPIEVPPSLVWPTIAVRGEITTTLGRAGKGKTTMNLNRIFAWACGRSLFPGWEDSDGNEYLKPSGPLKTLIAENEGNAGMFHQKVGLLLHQGPLDKDQREQCLDNLWIHGDGGYSGMKLDNPAGVDKLRAACEKSAPDIVFIEPFRSLWRGEENSATDMAKVVDNLVGLATEFQCAIILSHHMRKGGLDEGDDRMSMARGSSVLEGVVAVMESFESVKENEYREMTWAKARYLPPPTTVRMEWDRSTGWYTWVPTERIDESVLEALREADDEPMNLVALAEETGESKAKLRPVLASLVESNRIKKVGSAQLPGGAGSTGTRWRLISGEAETNAGLAL